MKPYVRIILLIPIALCPSAAIARGYTARSCGLDMNRNGIVGEPSDCNVCDATG